MARKKLTQEEIVLKALGKKALTDAQLAKQTGIAFAHVIRAGLKRKGLVKAVGLKKNKDTNRTVKLWASA